jgi:tRNA threonylcarbamoyladenosine biosynthesis protein TsaE
VRCVTICGAMITCNDPQSIDPVMLHSASAAETERLGERIGKILRDGDLVLLSGTLGAGKTCLTRGLARGWGAVEQPTSPTFTLINEYHRESDQARFYHSDCYRIDGVADAASTGIEDLFGGSGVLVIEWAERIEALLPSDYLLIEIEEDGEDTRRFTLSSCGHRPRQMLDQLRA